MMRTRKRAWTRGTVLITTAAVLIVLVVGGYFGHKLRKRALIAHALDQGLAAYAEQDWETARVKLGQYLSAHPDEPEILAKYAESQLNVRPLAPQNVNQAIGAYRRLFRLDASDKQVFDRLVLLYENTGNLAELAHVAEKRLEVVPDDPAAIIARCRDLARRQRPEEARAALEALYETLTKSGESSPEFAEATMLLCELVLQSGAAEAPQQALTLLEQAAALNPDAPLLLAQRAALLRALAQTPGEDSEAHLAAARQTLEQAERCAAHDPRALLVVARHWQGLGDLDRVPPLLDAAEQVPADALRSFVVDPRDWEIACFQARAEWLLASEQPQACVELADRALDRFTDDPYRTAVLPTALRLYLVGARVAEARSCLDTYLADLVARGSAEKQSPRVSLLRAMVAHAEDTPYEVIALLEPLVRDGTAPPGVQGLLADAYARTDQQGRMAHVLGFDSGAPAPPAVMLRLARVAAARGQWDRAERLLARLDDDQRAAPEVALLQLGIQLGRAYQGDTPDEDIGAALAALRDLRDQYPTRADIRVLLALAETSQERADVAERELRDAIDACEDPWPATLALAQLYRTNQRADDALDVVRAACERDGTTAAPWLTLAEQLIARDEVPAARETLARGRDAVTEPSDRRRLEIQLAVLDVLYGDADAGLARLRELAAADPQDIRLRAGLLALPEIRRDPATAQALVGEMKAVEGDTGIAWRIAQARLWLTQPRWQDHKADIEQLLKYCLEATPDRPEPVLLLGRMYAELGQPAAAEALYAAGLQTTDSPEVADALLALLQQQRRFSEARALLERVQRRGGPQTFAARQLALALEAGQYDDAIRQLEFRAARENRDPADLIRLAGLVYNRDHALAPALAHLDEAAALGADPVEVARARVAILIADERPADAEQVLNDLIAETPTMPAYFLRAAYYATADQPERAIADYAKVAEIAPDDTGYATLGEFHARHGDLDEAIAAWEEGLRAFPESTTLRRGLCKALLLRRGEHDLAEVDLLLEDLRTTLGGDRVELLWIAALRLSAENAAENRDQVAALLDQAIQALPAGPDAYEGLAGVALDSGWPARARAIAIRGLELHPGNVTLRLRQASAEWALGNPNAAIDFARVVLDQEPGNIPAMQLLLSVAAEQGQTAVLRDGLQRIARQLRAAPEDEQLHLLHAQTLLALGEPGSAAEGLEAFRASDERHNTLPVLLTLAQIHHSTNAPEAAARYVALAAEQAPQDPRVVSAGLNVLAAQGHFDDLALQAGEYADGPEPHPGVLLEAATLLARDADHRAAAIALCRRAGEVAPDYAAAWLTLGSLEYEQGELPAARAAYEQVLARQPNNPEALNNLAWVLGTDPNASAEQLERARDYARQAVEQDPRNVNYRDTLAAILMRIPTELAAAREEFQRCAGLAPPDSPSRARAFFQLAQACALLGESATVADALHQALAVQQVLAARGEPVFTAAEQREIDRLLQSAQNN